MTISRLNSDTTYLPAFRNLIINGAMQVAQRGTSVTGITTQNYYTADRWLFSVGTMGTWTQTIENDAPTGSGFRKSLKVLCTTADAAPAAGDLSIVAQLIEGQNLQAIKKGTANAEQLTLSFWVKSNVTGTYIAELYDIDGSQREVSASYSISSSGTWEKKTIVFPADTTGAFDNDNQASLALNFWLGAGSTFTSGTLQTTWASVTNANRAAGQTNLAAATNNYWQITGVQLEIGAVATPFEFKPYAQDLRECQRYFLRDYPLRLFSDARDTNLFFAQYQHPTELRADPTFSSNANSSAGSTAPTTTGQVSVYGNAWIGASGASVAFAPDGGGKTTAVIYLAGFATPALGRSGTILLADTTYIQFSAEL